MDVACATVLDIVCSMLTPLLLIVVLMGKNMLELTSVTLRALLPALGKMGFNTHENRPE